MPYIADTNGRRKDLDPHPDQGKPAGTGELNYAITKLVDDYIAYKGLSYQHINDVLGVLEGAKLEFYRRVAAPYEDKKIITNGDVYTCPRSTISPGQ